MRLHPLTRAAVGVLLVAALAGCTGGDPDPAGTGTPTADPGPQPEDVVATAVVPEGGVDLEVRVHPLVRAGEHVVLTLDLVPVDGLGGKEYATVSGFGVASFLADGTAPVNVRLLDLEHDVVHHVGAGADGEPVVAPAEWDWVRAEHGTRLQMPFAAPVDGVDALSVLVPGAPLFAQVPIVDGDLPSAAHPDDVAAAATASARASATPSASADLEALGPAEELDLDAVVDAPTFPLESTSAELAGAVTTTESTEKVEVTLGSDVLFAVDSADLSPAAAEAVALVAQRLSEREPGTVAVVGHTDDQADDAYNIDLSRRRAQAVADALAAQVDGARYPTEVEGRGEAEPIASNGTEDGRAANRRVTVTLTSTVVTRTDVTTAGELPPFGAHVGTAGTPTTVDNGVRTWQVDATARRVHGHVVVDLTVHAADEKDGSGWAVSFLSGYATHRGTDTVTPHAITARGTVLQGATRLFPLDYRVGADDTWPGGEWFTASDLEAGAWIDGGQTRTYSFVYPRLDTDTVVFQAGTGVAFDDDFRLLDVPVAPEVTTGGAAGDDEPTTAATDDPTTQG